MIIEQDPGFVSEDDEDRSVPTEDKKQDQDDAEANEEQVGRGDQRHGDYLDVGDDVLLKHLQRQCAIICDALQERSDVPLAIADVSLAYERHLFSPRVPPNAKKTAHASPTRASTSTPYLPCQRCLPPITSFSKTARYPYPAVPTAAERTSSWPCGRALSYLISPRSTKCQKSLRVLDATRNARQTLCNKKTAKMKVTVECWWNLRVTTRA